MSHPIDDNHTDTKEETGGTPAMKARNLKLAIVLAALALSLFAASAEDDRLGIPVLRAGERIEYAYPVAILVAELD